MKRVRFIPDSTTRAFWLGMKDGFWSPSEFGSRLTWEPEGLVEGCIPTGKAWDACYALNKAYDHGVNQGQIIGGILKRQMSYVRASVLRQ